MRNIAASRRYTFDEMEICMRTGISRRQMFAMTAAAGLALRGGTATAKAEQSLGAVAAANGFTFGSAAGPVIDKDLAYRELYTTHAKIITTDIALKMGTIAPQPGPKQFASADRLLQFCAHDNIPMRGHCLIWNEWVPSWIKAMSKAERQTYFDQYIEEVVGRYAGRLQSWDIVNEPFWPGHKAPGGYRLGPWYDAFGTDYIRRAFERATSVDSRTPFVLNEAQTERDDDVGRTVRAGLLRLVDELKDAGVRLDAVGLQGHLQPGYPHDAGRFAEFVHALGERKVDIYITEFDVRDDTFPDDIAVRDAMIAETAEKFLNTVLRIPAVKTVITWELSDNYSFYTDAARKANPLAERLPRPLPFDSELKKKPLYYAMVRAFQNARKA
ncbi:glycoside hydrolase [Bradyrhizobium sp. WD16]|nr:glycoside hydrolase [Bradyrhizobium sp. WD16]